ncbi:hypothetical protein MMC25_001335 [Agyrium rufum]|nr:hypothetical protein [Agyrium rufum]
MTSIFGGLLSKTIWSWSEQFSTRSVAKENVSHYWEDPQQLLSSAASSPRFSVSNGATIYNETLIPAIRDAEHEVLFVTCFWAASQSLKLLASALRHLSEKAIARGDGSKIRVSLCFSSRSLIQLLFHTSSVHGYVYPPSQWYTTLGLPKPSELEGLDLQIKSIFLRPVSVMHPKFLIVDRELAFLPSCNASWEEWLECCVSMRGQLVTDLLRFYSSFWGQLAGLEDEQAVSGRSNKSTSLLLEDDNTDPLPKHPMILLPSPPHNSYITSLPYWPSSPPATPLNLFVLEAIKQARKSILFISPNVTSPPILQAMQEAFIRGVNIEIITNRRMMFVEQLVTAGTLTEICMWRLARRHRKLHKEGQTSQIGEGLDFLERGSTDQRYGDLTIRYFRSAHGFRAHKSHVKCTILDDEVMILGSGNMDRASWYTSQELGLALPYDPGFANQVLTNMVLDDYYIA